MQRQSNNLWRFLCSGILLAFAISVLPSATLQAQVRVLADGLAQPVGLAVDRSKRLWVSEMGVTPVGVPPVAFNGRISYLNLRDSNPTVIPFLTGLGTALNAVGEPAGAHHLLTTGANSLWLVTGGPPSFVVPTMGSVYELDISRRRRDSAPHTMGGPTNNFDSVAVRQSFEIATATLEAGYDDSNAYSIAKVRGELYVIDAFANAVFKRKRGSGNFQLFATLPPVNLGSDQDPNEVDAVPTKIIDAGNFKINDERGNRPILFVAQLTGYPFQPGAARIWSLDKHGEMEVFIEGLTNIVDIALDPENDALILVSIGEWSDDIGFFQPGTGRILSIDEDGEITTILADLFAPTAVALDTRGNLYTTSVATGEILMLERD